jgi:hypothetical protein
MGNIGILPTDYSILLTEIPTSDKIDCNSIGIKPRVKVISHDEYQKLIRNYYQKPFLNTQTGDAVIWRMFDNSSRITNYN